MTITVTDGAEDATLTPEALGPGAAPIDLIARGEALLAHLAAARAGRAVGLLSINADVAAAARPGAVLEGRARITRATRSVLFVSGELTLGGRIVLTLTALYKVTADA